MKFFLRSFLCLLLPLMTATAFASPPTLTPIDPNFPTKVQPGQAYTFHLKYTQAQGDPPTSLKMVVEPPTGSGPISGQASGTDATAGIPVSWSFLPEGSGDYRYHFEAISSTGASVRFPASAAADYPLEVVNVTARYITLAIGLIVALLFVPFVVYLGTRAINKQGDPSATARVALLIGIIASYALYLYLFSFYGLILNVLAGVVALAILVVLFSKRRTA